MQTSALGNDGDNLVFFTGAVPGMLQAYFLLGWKVRGRTPVREIFLIILI